jgi:hypothetical protein
MLNRDGSLKPVFPLLPWAGYVFLGGAFGALAGSHPGRAVKVALFVLTGVSFGAARMTPWFMSVYPPHQYAVTDPSNHAQRLTYVALTLLVLLFVEERMPDAWRAKAPIRFVELFGTTSLAAYFFHEQLLFLHLIPHHSLADLFRDRLGWAPYVAFLLAVWAATAVLVKVADLTYPRWEALLKSAGKAVTSRLSA